MATHDLLGTLEAIHALGLGTADAAASTAKGTLLATAITAVSEAFAEKCGTIIYGTVTGELHDGGRDAVWLKNTPVQGVVTVVEYDGTTAATLTAETNAAKYDDGYTVNLANGKVSRRNDNTAALFPVGSDNVYVTYVAGRFASTSTVSQKFKEAAEITLKNLWRTFDLSAAQSGDFDIPLQTFPRFAIPNAAKELLAREWRTGSGIGD